MSNLASRAGAAKAQVQRAVDGDAHDEAAAMEPSKTGWMLKKGGVRRAWANRWFELRGAFLFRSEKEGGKVAGFTDLRQCSGVR